MPELDVVVHPDILIPIIPKRKVLSGLSIGIKDGSIRVILPRVEARRLEANEHIELPNHALMPGLINLYGQSAMSLFRGCTAQMFSNKYLSEQIDPTEKHFLSPEFVSDGSKLAIAEMLLAGITTFSDQYFFPEMTAIAADQAGIRATLNFPITDTPTAWARNSEECISKGLTLRDDYRHHDRINVGFSPRSIVLLGDNTLDRIAVLAEELEALIQITLHETPEQVLSAIEQFGERPLDHLSRRGLLSPRTQCVHMNDLGSQDIETLAKNAAHVINCPRNNLRLGSGICPVQRLAEEGINVALGTGSAATNNRLNLLSEIQAVVLIEKILGRNSTPVDPWLALEMSTICGAKALGQDETIGSLELGKAADLIALDLSPIQLGIVNDIPSAIAYGTNGTEITWCWVAGQSLVRERTLQTLDEIELRSKAKNWKNQLTTFHQTLES